MHPTRKLLLDTAARLLESQHPDAVSGQMVLRESGISHGSLYHHFEDASEVIEIVLIDRFFARARGDLEILAAILDNAADREAWIASSIALTRAVHAPANAPFRMRRVQLLSYAASRPRMLARLAREQSDLTTGFANVFLAAQAKGWLATDIEARAGAVFIQAIILGRVIDDISSEQIDPEAWNYLLTRTIAQIYGAQDSPAR